MLLPMLVGSPVLCIVSTVGGRGFNGDKAATCAASRANGAPAKGDASLRCRARHLQRERWFPSATVHRRRVNSSEPWPYRLRLMWASSRASRPSPGRAGQRQGDSVGAFSSLRLTRCRRQRRADHAISGGRALLVVEGAVRGHVHRRAPLLSPAFDERSSVDSSVADRI
jgi:hypothetical protein